MENQIFIINCKLQSTAALEIMKSTILLQLPNTYIMSEKEF